MLRIIILSLVVLCGSLDVSYSMECNDKTSADYNVKVGSILFCRYLDMPDQQQSPKMYDWAITNGILELSAISKQASYTDKITTKNELGSKALIIGCWITEEILTEKVSGKEIAYAKASFHINDSIKSSPFMGITVCKPKKYNKQIPVYDRVSLGSQYIMMENPSIVCNKEYYTLLPNLSAMENESIMFNLRRGYGSKQEWLY